MELLIAAAILADCVIALAFLWFTGVTPRQVLTWLRKHVAGTDDDPRGRP